MAGNPAILDNLGSLLQKFHSGTPERLCLTHHLDVSVLNSSLSMLSLHGSIATMYALCLDLGWQRTAET